MMNNDVDVDVDDDGDAQGAALAAGNAMENAVLARNTKKIYASKYLFFKNYMRTKHPHTYDGELADINPRLFTAELAKEFFGDFGLEVTPVKISGLS